jgi:UDP-GlcNAc:undecaprenyl-phosphate/decaprenyl-phosphate GlcNAc-1-phosphate transferase
MTNNRWLFACALSALVCFVVILGLRNLAFRIGLVDAPGGRKRHGDTVPLLGGVAIILSTLCALFVVPPGVWPGGFLRPFLVAIALIGLAGILDDLHEISATVKLLFQFASISMLTSFSGVGISDLGTVLTSDIAVTTGSWSIPFTFLAAIGLMNAVNMTDGLDGLLGGSALVTLLSLAYVAKSNLASESHFFVLSFVSVALTVFLVFNFPFRGRFFRTFLGDTGSLFLGLIICWFSVMLSQKPLSIAPPVVFVWFCGVFLLDFLCTTIHRLIRRQNPTRPDRRHWHHLLLRAGFSQPVVTIFLVSFHSILCVLGVAMWKAGVAQHHMLYFAIALLACAIWINLSAVRWVPAHLRRVRKRSANSPKGINRI